MRRERTDAERLLDNAVLLTLWARAQERSGGEAAGDKLKLMKLAFLAAYPLYLDRVKALNLRFYRWTWGPMADQVYDTWGDLVRHGLLLDEERFIVSEEGIRLSAAFAAEVLALEANRRVLETLDQVAEVYGPLSTDQTLERVYAMRCYTSGAPGRKRPVKALPHGEAMIDLLEAEEAESLLVVPPGWQVTLELAFHPDALHNLRRGIEDSHEGRVYDWEAVWANV